MANSQLPLRTAGVSSKLCFRGMIATYSGIQIIMLSKIRQSWKLKAFLKTQIHVSISRKDYHNGHNSKLFPRTMKYFTDNMVLIIIACLGK